MGLTFSLPSVEFSIITLVFHLGLSFIFSLFCDKLANVLISKVTCIDNTALVVIFLQLFQTYCVESKLHFSDGGPWETLVAFRIVFFSFWLYAIWMLNRRLFSCRDKRKFSQLSCLHVRPHQPRIKLKNLNETIAELLVKLLLNYFIDRSLSKIEGLDLKSYHLLKQYGSLDVVPKYGRLWRDVRTCQ